MRTLLAPTDQYFGSAVPGSGPNGTASAATGSLRIATSIPSDHPHEPAHRFLYGATATRFGTRLLFGETAMAGARGLAIAARLLDGFRGGAEHESDLGRVAYQMALSVSEERMGSAQELARLTLLEHRPDGMLAVVNRGMPAPVLVGWGEARSLAPPLAQPAIGLLNPGSLRVPPHAVRSRPGERILLFTGPEPRTAGGGPMASDPGVAAALSGPFNVALERLREVLGGDERFVLAAAECLVEIGEPADATAASTPGEATRRARLARNPLRA
ncbi:SpoIIE family protein phosphatase [Yinghuangia seranimata]|uniref:SpoIIE family protein phosphatase n=1 Tax=Yinghuangia seranimata TaxID=408067 RepID=UPI00248B7A76|nr:SpoIIE family protein phosphatase [Yinghuangia seranimata]MDI2129927.1 SpoIIE family protein phosphatase [Yinghuangia seranimata]